MSKLNPCDLVGMRKAAERTTVSTQRRYAKVLDPDLLSIAGQVVEAARSLNAAIDSVYDADGYDLCKPWPERVKVTEALAAWDAAMKGRK